ncbi:hypothetical protein AA100600_1849 [Gluconobacter thailandicus F149-1 = NBRC 100600]|nr:hypothetical protein AA100600_1849 [Gluconobacter thailandicus F149-1 = NBRC 100600]
MVLQIRVMPGVKRRVNDRGLSDTPISVLGERREVGFGRIPCQPGQVRKEAAAVSFIRVKCPASYQVQPVGATGFLFCAPAQGRQRAVFMSRSDGFPVS